MGDILVATGGNQTSLYEELYREYLEDRTLFINDEISENAIEDYVMYILKWNKEDKGLPIDCRKPIRIYISSPGGNVFNANNMIDIITQSKTPIIGICLDLAASAAYLILLSCHKRYGFKNSVFLQHEGDMVIENSRSKFKQTADFFNDQEEKTKEYILSRTNMTSEFYDSIYDIEFWMNAEKAKEYNIIDGIIGKDIDIDELL
jgi:ATP-dependent Clp protease protease subunit